eukprot:gb/GECH01009504.1/.p1 GENE.gb/GECH01009504.1/~~gb/GECH01009504.1/.p1  ORF type:complete len:137 (+),score=31.82 gb/GECH01009504.1/:1-411(+)
MSHHQQDKEDNTHVHATQSLDHPEQDFNIQELNIPQIQYSTPCLKRTAILLVILGIQSSLVIAVAVVVFATQAVSLPSPEAIGALLIILAAFFGLNICVTCCLWRFVCVSESETQVPQNESGYPSGDNYSVQTSEQ